MRELLIGSGNLGAAEWIALFTHFLMLSLLAVGGAISTVSDMHRVVVAEQGWLTDAQFTGSVALAQAAPGPNVLFVAVIGFNVGGLAGVVATMVGTLLPSTILALAATRFNEANRDAVALRAFTAGLAPLTIGLLVSTAWILLEPVRVGNASWWSAGALAAAAMGWLLATRWSPVWPIALGAAVGIAGWV